MKVKHQNEILLFFLLITFMYQVPEFFITIARHPLGKLLLLIVVVYSYKMFGLYNGILVTLIVILILEHTEFIEGMTDERDENEEEGETSLDEMVDENVENEEVQGNDLLDVEDELNRNQKTENDEDGELNELLNETDDIVEDGEPVGDENTNIENFSNYN